MPLDEVRPRVEREVRARKKADMAAAKLSEVRAQVEGGVSLEEAAGAAGLEVRASEPFARTESVPGIGRGNGVVAAAFRLQEGQLSDVVTLRQGAYLLRLAEKAPLDEALFAEQSAQVQQQLLAQRQQEALQNWFAQIYENAVIEDNRHLFFTF